MWVKGVQILQKGLYEGTRDGRRTFVCVFTSHHQHEEKKLQRLFEDICKQSVTAGKITRMLVQKIKPRQY
jgi:hypothetical protein